MSRALILLSILITGVVRVCAQECPQENPSGPSIESASLQLFGFVEYHDNIRQWTSLRLQTPVCGVRSIQLLDAGGGAFEVDEGNAVAVSRYRGCHVKVSGTLGIPGTGYYSENLYLNVENIHALGECELKTPLPAKVTGKPDPEVSRYQVSMTIDYRTRGGRVVVVARSHEKTLSPWQLYASYFLTGGYVLYAQCEKGFALSKLKAPTEANPSVTDDVAGLDPESAAQKHVRVLHVSYTCKQESAASGDQ